jgi:thymidylate kinase
MSEPGRPSPLVLDLAGRLEEARVRYCHWKSNLALDRSLAADNDLDLLVARSDLAAFNHITAGLGFVRARSLGRPQVLGIEDLFGWDPEVRKVVHLQPHFELIVGDDMTKSYRLPIEHAYLESVRPGAGLPVPAPELEYLVLVVRLVLKHGPWEAQLARKGRPTRSERAELEDLAGRVDHAAVDRLRADLLPTISADTFDRCRAACEPGSSPLVRSVAARRLVGALAHDARRSPRADVLAKRVRRWWNRPGSRGKGPAAGGLLVAVVGGDGSGKTTAVDRLVDALEEAFVVARIHLGKPPRGLARRLMRRVIALGGRRGRFEWFSLPAWHEFESSPGTAHAVWHWLIARDRMRLYTRARRLAGRGQIVVSDRFPLATITRMDGPRTGSVTAGEQTWPARWFAAREQAIYRAIRPPDVLIVLRVDPEVAVARRPEQDPLFVRHRAEEIWSATWGPAATVIDAGQLPEVVAEEAIAAVWRRL